MVITASNVTLNVKNLDGSIAFYESIGLKLKGRWGNFYAQVTGPDIVIGLHPTDENQLKTDSGNASIGFTIDDFEGAKSRLMGLSIRSTDRQEEGGSFLHFVDPDGNALYFIKPKW